MAYYKIIVLMIVIALNYVHTSPPTTNFARSFYSISFKLEDPCYSYEKLYGDPNLIKCYDKFDETANLIREYSPKKTSRSTSAISTRIVGMSGSNLVDKISNVIFWNESEILTEEELRQTFESELEGRLQEKLHQKLSNIFMGLNTTYQRILAAREFMDRHINQSRTFFDNVQSGLERDELDIASLHSLTGLGFLKRVVNETVKLHSVTRRNSTSLRFQFTACQFDSSDEWFVFRSVNQMNRSLNCLSDGLEEQDRLLKDALWIFALAFVVIFFLIGVLAASKLN